MNDLDEPNSLSILERASPELQTVIRCLRHALGTESDGTVFHPNASIDGVIAQIQRHRVASFLHQRLPTAVAEALPAPIRHSLRDLALRNAQRSLARHGELRRIRTAFQDANIRCLVFKGPVIEHDLYGVSGVRHSGDIDLLVSPADVPRADALVSSLGYERTYPRGSLSPVKWRHFLRAHHELNHRDRSRGNLIEIQWETGGLPKLDFETLWKSRRTWGPAGTEPSILSLSRDVSDLILFVHGAGHQWALLFWLLDIAWMVRDRSRADFEHLLHKAHEYQVQRALLQGSLLANSLLGIPIPEPWKSAIDAEPSVRPLADFALGSLVASESPGTNFSKLVADLGYQWKLNASFKARRHLLVQRLLSVENWELFPLPDRYFWLYYPLAPLLWIARKRTQTSASHSSSNQSEILE